MSAERLDMSVLAAKHTGAHSARRVRKRRWAEFRLKAYGVLAILIAASALVVLVYTIVAKTRSVVNEFYLSLDVELAVSDRHLATLTDGNPATRVDLKKPLRAALADVANSELRGRKAAPLNSLLSRFEGYELSGLIERDPSLIGARYQYEVLLDDDVQLYLKGNFGAFEEGGTAGVLLIEPGESESAVQLRFASTAFGPVREAMRRDRSDEARNLRRSAGDQARAYTETLERLEAATDDDQKARLQAQVDSFAAARDAGIAAADAALAEATDPQATFALRTDDPSVFIRVNRGWIKVIELSGDAAKGVIMDPITSMDAADDGDWAVRMMETPEGVRRINDRQALWLENFKREDRLVSRLNWRVLTASDSSNAELAGIWGALTGSFWTMMVTFGLVFPIGVCASIYLEEFAPKNRLTDLIEVNINNLAAVPSIVFGLLGLTVLLSGVNLFGYELFDGLLKAVIDDPRSTPLAGGVVLALMSLPTIIIASRASIKAVPPSIRDAALGLGASKLQTSTHHVLPLAMPGILTGSIIAMAQALGETAPLIIIGMNSFIQDPPGDPLDKANVLPSLIYLWNNNSERLFDGKTAVAISVLLLFLVIMNALAVVMRKRFERRW